MFTILTESVFKRENYFLMFLEAELSDGYECRSRVSLVNLLVMAGWRLEWTPGLCLWIVSRVGVEPTVSMTNTRPSVELSYTWETSTNARPQGKKKNPDMSTSRIDKGSYFTRLSFRHYDLSGDSIISKWIQTGWKHLTGGTVWDRLTDFRLHLYCKSRRKEKEYKLYPQYVNFNLLDIVILTPRVINEEHILYHVLTSVTF